MSTALRSAPKSPPEIEQLISEAQRLSDARQNYHLQVVKTVYSLWETLIREDEKPKAWILVLDSAQALWDDLRGRSTAGTQSPESYSE